MLLKADGNTGLLNQIETLTKSFGKIGKADFSNFAIVCCAIAAWPPFGEA